MNAKHANKSKSINEGVVRRRQHKQKICVHSRSFADKMPYLFDFYLYFVGIDRRFLALCPLIETIESKSESFKLLFQSLWYQNRGQSGKAPVCPTVLIPLKAVRSHSWPCPSDRNHHMGQA